MGTSAFIAATYKASSKKGNQVAGSIIHYDGYPSGVGVEILRYCGEKLSKVWEIVNYSGYFSSLVGDQELGCEYNRAAPNAKAIEYADYIATIDNWHQNTGAEWLYLYWNGVIEVYQYNYKTDLTDYKGHLNFELVEFELIKMRDYYYKLYFDVIGTKRADYIFKLIEENDIVIGQFQELISRKQMVA